MWQNQPTGGLPTRQPFQTFDDRRRSRNRRRIVLLAVLAILVVGVLWARKQFPEVEAKLRAKITKAVH
jgi:uncharacterized membrane protein YdfJ with MMPL/SSD domain